MFLLFCGFYLDRVVSQRTWLCSGDLNLYVPVSVVEGFSEEIPHRRLLLMKHHPGCQAVIS
jgi:hypothetical protein